MFTCLQLLKNPRRPGLLLTAFHYTYRFSNSLGQKKSCFCEGCRTTQRRKNPRFFLKSKFSPVGAGFQLPSKKSPKTGGENFAFFSTRPYFSGSFVLSLNFPSYSFEAARDGLAEMGGGAF